PVPAQVIDKARFMADKQRGILVEYRDGVAQSPPPLPLLGLSNSFGLQGIQPYLGQRIAEPYQRIEEVMQVVARGHATGLADVGFISGAGWKLRLRNEAKCKAAMIAQIKCCGCGIDGMAPIVSPDNRRRDFTKGSQPWPAPVDLRKKGGS